jgi:hypothetical protein
MGEPLDVLPEAIPVECLDRVDDPSVQLAPARLQQSAVRDLVGEGVLEGVLEIWIQSGLVEELGRLESVQSVPEPLVREISDCLEGTRP